MVIPKTVIKVKKNMSFGLLYQAKIKTKATAPAKYGSANAHL
jgi:hypothetical protein